MRFSAFFKPAVFKLVLVICILALVPSIAACGILPVSGDEELAEIYAFINPTNSEHWQQIASGMEGAAADENLSIAVYELNLSDDYKSSIDMIKNAIKKSPGAIIMPKLNDPEIEKLLVKAQKKEIPLLFIDASDSGNIPGTRIYSNNERAAEKAGHMLAKLLDGVGEIVMLNIAVDNPRALEREKGFLTAIKDYPDIKLLNAFDCNGSRETAKKTLVDILAAHPDIRGIFTACPETSAGAVSVLTTLDLKDNITIVAFDHPTEIANYMNAGSIAAAVGQSPYQIGYIAVEAASEIFKGEEVSDSIDVGFDFVENRIGDSENTPED